MKKGQQEKSKAEKGEKGDKKQASSHPIAPKNKLRTEGVHELKYDRYSATSFANFERDLRLVAGQEFGDLFGYVLEGRMPPDNIPIPFSLEVEHEDKIATLKATIDRIQDIPPDLQTIRQRDELEDAEVTRAELIQEWNDMSEAKKQLMNLQLQEAFKAQMIDAVSNKNKHKENAPKLYWMIRRNMSEESTDKIKEYLAGEWEESEKTQDPVALWQAIKFTHTAYSTGNPFTDKQQLRQAYSEMRMHSGETLMNLKLRFTTAIRAMVASNVDIPSEADQAADFISKLDSRGGQL